MTNALVKEGGWVAVGQILSALAALVSMRVMTELLSPIQFGRLTLMLGLVALALGLTATPRLQAVMRYYPEWRALGRTNVLRRVSVRLIGQPVVAAAFFLLIGGCVYAVAASTSWWAGSILAVLLVVDVMRSFELVLLNSARRQRISAAVNAADGWLRPLFAVMAVLVAGASAEAALAGYALSSAAVLLLLHKHGSLEGASKQERNRSEVLASGSELSLARSIRKYAWPLLPLAVLGWVNGMGDRYIIAGMLSVGEVGLYAAAYGLASRPFLMVSSVIELTFRPVLQNAVTCGDKKTVGRVKAQMLMAMVGSASVGALGFLLLSDLAAFLFLAPPYRTAASLMPWIAAGYAMLSVSTVYARICYACDATDYILRMTLLSGAIGLLALIALASMYGLKGAVLAVPIRFGVELVLSLSLARMAERRHAAAAGSGLDVVR